MGRRGSRDERRGEPGPRTAPYADDDLCRVPRAALDGLCDGPTGPGSDRPVPQAWTEDHHDGRRDRRRGFVPTYQPAHFGRVYAAYGAVFVVLSMLWGWGVDRVAPDRFDLAGSALCLIGVVVIMYWPR